MRKALIWLGWKGYRVLKLVSAPDQRLLKVIKGVLEHYDGR